jgi:hypothetical protein
MPCRNFRESRMSDFCSKLSRLGTVLAILFAFGNAGCRKSDDVIVRMEPKLDVEELDPDPLEDSKTGERIIGAIVPMKSETGTEEFVFFKLRGAPVAVGKRSTPLETLVASIDFNKKESLLKDILAARPKGWEQTRNREMISLTIRTSSRLTPLNLEVSTARGDLDGNVNRWRGQVGLDPATSEEMAKCRRTIKTADGRDAYFVDVAGPGAKMDMMKAPFMGGKHP